MTGSAPRFPHPCLVADVGGTNARFAVVAEPGAPPSTIVRLDTGAAQDFAATVGEGIAKGGFVQPRSFLLAVAGPVAGRAATLTNARSPGGRLRVDGAEIAVGLGLEQGLLLNDFEALSLALPTLPDDALAGLAGGVGEAGAPMVVIGPGTGLGVGALLRIEERWLAVASEGGHVDIGPQTAAEHALWPFLGDAHVSAEELLSGRGLRRIYLGVCAMRSQAPGDAAPAAISARAIAGLESAARESVGHFFALLARCAGDMALTFCARGGVFIGGGIAPRLAGMIDAADFAGNFRNKGAARTFLETIPVRMIIAPDAALRGLAAIASRPDDYFLDYPARLWV